MLCFHNNNAIYMHFALYVMIVSFVSLNILVYFTNIIFYFIFLGAGYFGIIKLIYLTDSKRQEETFKLI